MVACQVHSIIIALVQMWKLRLRESLPQVTFAKVARPGSRSALICDQVIVACFTQESGALWGSWEVLDAKFQCSRYLFRDESYPWAGGMAQSVKYLCCEHEDPSSSPSTHIKSWVLDSAYNPIIIPAGVKQGQKGPQSLQAAGFACCAKFWANKRLSQKKKLDSQCLRSHT